MKISWSLLPVGVLASTLAVVMSVHAQGLTDMKKGEGGSAVQGAAGPSGAVATLGRGEEMIFMGKEQDGFLGVETTHGGGWVKKVLVTR